MKRAILRQKKDTVRPIAPSLVVRETTQGPPRPPIHFANTDLQTAFEAVHGDIDQYRAYLDAVSEDIRRVEAYLRDSPIRIPFVTSGSDKWAGTGALIWHDHNDTGRWRLCMPDEEHCRPLIEAKAIDRVKLSVWLPEVMRVAGELARGAVKTAKEA